jgi:3-deoxy-D-manno-octulosonic-acid transferase
MSLAWTLYHAAAPWAARGLALATPFLAAEERRLWPEREGRVRAARADAWIHAASMGEALAVGPLLEALRATAPGALLHVTATTRSGRGRLAALGAPVSLAPLDAPGPVARFFETVAPRRLLIVETEVWPHWLEAARARAVPVAFVSARLSERSLAGYRRLGTPLRDLCAGLAAVLCQSEGDAERWRALGAPADRVRVTGNLKNDALPVPGDRRAARERLGLDPARPVLVLGSVRPGELRVLAPVWHALDPALRARWQVAVVPRHPRAAAALRREARAAGLSEGAASGWRWEDRLGVLRDYYAACDIGCVGGSFAAYGGHHPLEPAAAGAAVAIGPYHATQGEGVALLAAAGALPPIRDVAGALAWLSRLIGDDAVRMRATADAARAVAASRGATARTLDHLTAWAFWPPA